MEKHHSIIFAAFGGKDTIGWAANDGNAMERVKFPVSKELSVQQATTDYVAYSYDLHIIPTSL